MTIPMASKWTFPPAQQCGTALRRVAKGAIAAGEAAATAAPAADLKLSKKEEMKSGVFDFDVYFGQLLFLKKEEIDSKRGCIISTPQLMLFTIIRKYNKYIIAAMTLAPRSFIFKGKGRKVA